MVARSILLVVAVGWLFGATPARVGDPPLPATSSPVATVSRIAAAANTLIPVRAPARPVLLQIPALGISSPVVTVGLDRNGAIATPCDPSRPYAPCDPNRSAWFNGSVRPGSPGNAIIDGHNSWYGARPGLYRQAVFTFLKNARTGEGVTIGDAAGRSRDFVIDSVQILPWPQEPPDLFARSGPAGVWLTTCYGPWVNLYVGDSHRVWVHGVQT